MRATIPWSNGKVRLSLQSTSSEMEKCRSDNRRALAKDLSIPLKTDFI